MSVKGTIREALWWKGSVNASKLESVLVKLCFCSW